MRVRAVGIESLLKNMADIHAEQIQRLKEEEAYALGYIFDQSNTLIGTIEDTSESSMAVSLLGQLLCEEEYPQHGEFGNEHYYRICERLEQLGYQVVHAEWWYQKLDRNYSIRNLP